MAEDHRTILLLILATSVAGSSLFIFTLLLAGRFDETLIEVYVAPLFISAFTLSVYWTIVFARHKGRLSFLGPEDPAKEEKTAPAASKD